MLRSQHEVLKQHFGRCFWFTVHKTTVPTETLVNLNEKDMPEELSHEEVIALKDLDLDPKLLDINSDDRVDDMASPKQAQACPLFIY